MTSGTLAARKATESAIIRRFSSSETLRTSRAWKSQLLPTTVTAGVRGVDQGAHPGVVLGRDPLAPGHPEGGDPGVLEVEVADLAEVGGVLGVGERVAPLDVVDPEPVEAGGDRELVLEREVHPLALAAVA